ncbi:MAG: hypothetical protein CMP23_07360 [Rickettsiales bacterium]|nr:hypothetical protein [Rickettsiales bacterium]|tara:strand:- start:51 stop:488 length:438 start_codon:yes stop_codon:yes gene_type:complete
MIRRCYQLGFLVAFVTLGSAGCAQTCEVLCSENARYIDGCLEYWEAVWPDFGYDGLYDYDNADSGVSAQDPYDAGPSQEYIERCNERYSNSIRFGGPEHVRIVKVGCRTDLNALSESVGCLDYLPSDVDLDPTEGDNGTAPRPDG